MIVESEPHRFSTSASIPRQSLKGANTERDWLQRHESRCTALVAEWMRATATMDLVKRDATGFLLPESGWMSSCRETVTSAIWRGSMSGPTTRPSYL